MKRIIANHLYAEMECSMGQVTIYVEDSALEAAKQAAEKSKVSVSQWFAKFAV